MFKASQADLETQVDLVLGSVFVKWLFLRSRISRRFMTEFSLNISMHMKHSNTEI